MSIKKESIFDRRRTENKVALFAKITYISCDELPYFSALNERIAKKLIGHFSRLEQVETGLDCEGTLVLCPSITYLKNGIISAKYDLTLTSNGILLSHRRFCINACEEYGLLLSHRFFTHMSPFFHRDFYIKHDDTDRDILLVPIRRMLERGMVCAKISEIDTFCDGKPIHTCFKPPCGIDAASVSRAKSKAERDRTRPA